MGRVTAIELDAKLAARATANFAQTPHVRAVHGDGTRVMFEPADVIYVNAGATRPADAWLDQLKQGGRLIEVRCEMHNPNRSPGSLMTRRWREMDSNHQSLTTSRGSRHRKENQ